MDRARPVFKNNVQVFYLILDKKRASSHVIRKQRTPSQTRETGPSNFMRKKSSVYRSVGKKRPPFSLGKRRHEKEDSSVYPSVGEKRPPFSLGKGKRSCLSPLPLEKMEESMR